MNIKQKLIKEAQSDYKKFSSSLIPNINNILGVRLPILRKLAKEIYDKGNWQEFLQCKTCEYMEEIMLQGMIIGLIKAEPEKILEYVRNFIPKIDNWSVCDSFCTGLKFTKKSPKLVWNFIQPYFKSNKEFEIRFGFVMLLTYFVTEDYIDEILKIVDDFDDKRYYAQMGAAWLVSVCYVKFPEKTYKYLKTSSLDKWTLKKAIQKICESYRVSKEEKLRLKNS